MGILNYKTSKTGKRINYEMSDLQKLAQKENFALFTLVGMRSNLIHLQDVCPAVDISVLKLAIQDCESEIRTTQLLRKELRNTNKKASNIK